MHILYLHQHFAVPSGSTGTRSYEFARRWVKAGHKVTLITGFYDIGGLDSGGGLIQRQRIEGIEVIVVGSKYGNRMPFRRRILSFVAFMFFSVIAGLRVKNVDVIYATSTPLTIGIPAMMLKLFKRIPFVFEVRDQWPEIPIELGIIKNKLFKKILLWLEKTIYTNSSAIVALSPGIAEGIKDVTGNSKPITIVPNCSDLDVFRPDIDGSQIRKKYGWKDKFVLLHFGAMGKANGLDFVVDAAEKLAEDKNIHFVLIGDGGEKQKLKSRIAKTGLDNIEILDSVAKAELPFWIAATDVSIVIFADYPILEHNSANKFFDSLSAGKPVFLNYSGWQRKVLEDNNAGLGGELCDLEQFTANVRKLYEDKELVNEMSRNARKAAETSFSRDMLAERVLGFIKKTIVRLRRQNCELED